MSTGDFYVIVNFMFQYKGAIRTPKLKFSSPLITDPVKIHRKCLSTPTAHFVPILAQKQ
jgi:hypothetical protein